MTNPFSREENAATTDGKNEPTRVPRSKQPSGIMNLKSGWLFVLSLAVGTFFLIYSAVGNFDLMTTGLLAGLVMCPYCFAALRGAGTGANAEELADSCYYMGFLMTLIGLSVSLWSLGQSDGGNHVGQVVSRFGAAIVTTLVGMIFRILIVQQHGASASGPEAAERKVAESMMMVARELDSSIKQMEETRRATINNISQATKAAETRMNNAVEAQIKVTEEFTQEAFKRHGQILDDLSRTLSNVVIDTRPLQENLESIMGSIEDQMTRLNNSLHKIGDAGEATEERWAGLKNRLDVVANSLEGISNGAVKLNASGEALGQAGQRLESMTDALGNAHKVIGNIGATLESHDATVAHMKDGIEQNLEDLKVLREMVSAEHLAAAESTERVYEQLERALTLIGDKLSKAAVTD